MYKTILLPHDGTPAGDLAIEHAIHIAKSSSSEIIILHVIEDFPHVPVFSLHASQVTKIKKEIAQVTKEMKTVMEKEMTQRIETCKKNGIDSHLKVVVGLAAEEILKTVKNNKIDLIVMAKRRKLKGIKSLLTLGSVSRKIIENTSCPVLMMDAEKK
ncbi:MAG: universal stress protein [Nitrosopumilus sp.]|nr:universal stress protein [Nitrosopumilus sp.]MBL7015131.1 universal stress protein [Nitrosopumilus sp.]MBL7017563.1 universal stress protein [Nitrosopumilus sp.]